MRTAHRAVSDKPQGVASQMDGRLPVGPRTRALLGEWHYYYYYYYYYYY